MKLFPVEKITLKTKLSKKEVIERLIEYIEKEPPFSFGTKTTRYSKPYIGSVLGDSFDIRRAINYRNSFLPQIHGQIVEDYLGTKIDIKMTLHPIILAFTLMWCGFAFLISIICTYQLFKKGFNPLYFFSYAMLAFGILLTFTGFSGETSTSKKDLMKIFTAEII